MSADRKVLTLTRRLVLSAQVVSQQTARFLLAAEHCLPNGFFVAADQQIERPTAASLLEFSQRAPPAATLGLDITDVFDDAAAIRSRSRLAGLVFESWNRDVVSHTNGRPDVLAITCDFLTNPREPSTHTIVKFCVTLALRMSYGAVYTRHSLEQLRDSFESVHSAAISSASEWSFESGSSIDDLVVDLLCLNGNLQRCLTPADCESYYSSFGTTMFGVSRDTRRRQGRESRVEAFSGQPGEYGTLINLAFTQPSTIPGLDDVTGGLLAPVVDQDTSLPGGLITLVAGPPGSGKTSVCLAIASRMAELGAHVRYITIEEGQTTLEAKLDVVAGRLAHAFRPTIGDVEDEPLMTGEVRPRLRVMGREYVSLGQITEDLQKEFKAISVAELRAAQSAPLAIFLVFSRVVVIDSLTALRGESQHHGEGRAGPSVRRALSKTLNDLRALGVCVLLIGTKDDVADEGLAYLVDNVFTLDLDAKASHSHPVRVLNVEKTRLQASGRGRHVLHLGGASGCSVSPSLHAVLRQVARKRGTTPSDEVAAMFHFGPEQQIEMPGMDARDGFSLRAHSQILVFGFGSASKARFALTLAFEPRVPASDSGSSSEHRARRYLERSHVLVVSFLYEEAYYLDVAKELLQRRHGHGGDTAEHVEVVSFYPGMLTPEAVVASVSARMRSAELWGRPYTAVVIDGVHNIMMQFPLLDHEPLLWPTLYRLLRTKGVEAITTFTFFRMGGRADIFRRGQVKRTDVVRNIEFVGASPGGHLAVSQELFFHLLLSSCDYTFRMDQPDLPVAPGARGELVVQLVQGLEASNRAVSFEWQPHDFAMHRTTVL